MLSSGLHPIVLLSMATPLVPRTHLIVPGPHSGIQLRQDHPPTPATAVPRWLAAVRLLALMTSHSTIFSRYPVQ